MEEERSKGYAGLRVSLQLTKGVFEYATISIGAEKTREEGFWQRLAALSVCPDTSESHGDGRVSACHSAGMA